MVGSCALRFGSAVAAAARSSLSSRVHNSTSESIAEVGNPHGGINENHRAVPGRRRRTGRAPGSAPARAAKRRAASRAIKASSPARTKAVSCRMPDNSRARSSRASSITNVVLICGSLHDLCRCINTSNPAGKKSNLK
jgi:hypothetical protein